jgi:hypothetical protein
MTITATTTIMTITNATTMTLTPTTVMATTATTMTLKTATRVMTISTATTIMTITTATKQQQFQQYHKERQTRRHFRCCGSTGEKHVKMGFILKIYSLPNITNVVNSRIIRWKGHVARTGKMKSVHKISLRRENLDNLGVCVDG